MMEYCPDYLFYPFLEAEKASIEASVNAWKEKRDTAGEEIELDQAQEDPDIYAVPPDMSDADRLEEGKDRDFFYFKYFKSSTN